MGLRGTSVPRKGHCPLAPARRCGATWKHCARAGWFPHHLPVPEQGSGEVQLFTLVFVLARLRGLIDVTILQSCGGDGWFPCAF